MKSKVDRLWTSLGLKPSDERSIERSSEVANSESRSTGLKRFLILGLFDRTVCIGSPTLNPVYGTETKQLQPLDVYESLYDNNRAVWLSIALCAQVGAILSVSNLRK